MITNVPNDFRFLGFHKMNGNDSNVVILIWEQIDTNGVV